jgi:quercetin dioxygenase-like cupin family protein
MADQVTEVVEGDGFAVGTIEGVGEGYGFRKVRRELGVSAFGVNAVVLPAGYETGRHYHDEQQELYFVHEGRLEFEFGDGARYVLGPGGMARVDPSTVRKMKNVGDGDAVLLIAGGKGGYVGRDGRAPEGEESPRGPGFEGPPGAGPPLPGEDS